MTYPARGEIWIVNLDPTIGSEIRKKRPACILSNNINNKYASTVTVIPLTSSVGKVYPFETFLSAGEAGLEKDSKAKASQIRTIDKRRLVKRIGILEKGKVADIEQAVMIHLGFNTNI